MIISKKPTAQTPRWARALILLGAVALLPLGVAYAQAPEYEAVGRRLRTAVAEGELTPEQARTMLGALRRSQAPDLEAISKRLRAAVAESELTPEQAKAMMAALRNQDPRVRRYREAEREIKSAVAQGELSREDAEKKLIEIRKRLFPEREKHRAAPKGEDPRVPRYREVERLIKDAVQKGELSPEEAEKKLIEARKRLFRDR